MIGVLKHTEVTNENTPNHSHIRNNQNNSHTFVVQNSKMKKDEELIKWVKENFTPDAPLEYILSEYEKLKESESSVEITRFEVINHAKNTYQIGRLLTLYQELGDFNSIELSFQDGGRTLKVFLD
jgi:hypothetical protein